MIKQQRAETPTETLQKFRLGLIKSLAELPDRTDGLQEIWAELLAEIEAELEARELAAAIAAPAAQSRSKSI